jgi:hypothetical protein
LQEEAGGHNFKAAAFTRRRLLRQSLAHVRKGVLGLFRGLAQPGFEILVDFLRKEGRPSSPK